DPELGDHRGGPGAAAAPGLPALRAGALVAPARADLLVHVGDDRPRLEELLRLLRAADDAPGRADRRQARDVRLPGHGPRVRVGPRTRSRRAAAPFSATSGKTFTRTSVPVRTLVFGCRRPRTRSSFRARGSTTCATSR